MIGLDYASVDGNKPPNFELAYSAGCRFAVVRGAYTVSGTSVTDFHMLRDREKARESGLTFGAYLILGFPLPGRWSQASAAEQVGTFARVLGKRKRTELPPCLDVEFPNGRKATGLSARAALAWIESAYSLLTDVYGIVSVYTSARVWSEDLDGLDSPLLATAPLWIKTPYQWQARNPPHLGNLPAIGELPRPWRTPSSPGVWCRQFQGDAIGYPGFTSTVDLNEWRFPRVETPWLVERAGEHPNGLAYAIRAYQAGHGLIADGIVGPATFAALTQ